jgi:hypothetical protein
MTIIVDTAHSLRISIEQVTNFYKKNWPRNIALTEHQFNESLLKIIRQKGCGLGLTIEVGLAELGEIDPLLIPRLDTNDLPKSPDSPVSQWTLDAS